MILSPSAGYSRYIRSAANTCTCFSWKATMGSKEKRADNGAKARCKLSSRPAIAAILNSAPPSEVRQCSRYGAVYCVTTPAQLCIFSHQVGFPSSPQSKKAKTAARKLKTQSYCPVVCSFWARGGEAAKTALHTRLETVWRNETPRRCGRPPERCKLQQLTPYLAA